MMWGPWWFVLVVWPVVAGVLAFTWGYTMATGRFWWSDPRVRKWTRRRGR